MHGPMHEILQVTIRRWLAANSSSSNSIVGIYGIRLKHAVSTFTRRPLG